MDEIHHFGHEMYIDDTLQVAKRIPLMLGLPDR
jgi:hypothetical protein